MKLFKRTDLLMGNRFDLGVVGEEESTALQALEKAVQEIRRIEQLLTTYRPDSQVNLVNAKAGLEPQVVDLEMIQLIERARKISELTQGAFDLTYGSLDKRFWNFDQEMTELPSAELAKRTVQLINYQHIIVNSSDSSVFLSQKGMRIGFGGIGKGYAADRAKKVLLDCGFSNGLVNASGDMCAWGERVDGKDWTIGISNPDRPSEVFSEFSLRNSAVATSGNYEKFVMIGGRKYSHTIHPKTGFPIHGIKSVTIFAPMAELADALTTPIAVMGVDVGLNLINQIKGVGCLVIDDANRIHASDTIRSMSLAS
jgi:thiamine biosynthesis lipoprotein